MSFPIFWKSFTASPKANFLTSSIYEVCFSQASIINLTFSTTSLSSLRGIKSLLEIKVQRYFIRSMHLELMTVNLVYQASLKSYSFSYLANLGYEPRTPSSRSRLFGSFNLSMMFFNSSKLLWSWTMLIFFAPRFLIFSSSSLAISLYPLFLSDWRRKLVLSILSWVFSSLETDMSIRLSSTDLAWSSAYAGIKLWIKSIQSSICSRSSSFLVYFSRSKIKF
jgi:hypothetical protein